MVGYTLFFLFATLVNILRCLLGGFFYVFGWVCCRSERTKRRHKNRFDKHAWQTLAHNFYGNPVFWEGIEMLTDPNDEDRDFFGYYRQDYTAESFIKYRNQNSLGGVWKTEFKSTREEK